MNSDSIVEGEAQQFAAFVAVDWADRKHDWRLAKAGSGQQESGQIENTPEAVDAWAAGLRDRFPGRPIAVCLEQSRGALVYMLMKYTHLVLFPVHPRTAAQYRLTFCPSGAKSDAGDTASLLDLLLRHREQLRPLRPDTPQTRELALLVEYRRGLVNEKTREKNRLTSCLKQYFPQILQWFDEVESPIVGDLLLQWPTLPQLQHCHPGTLKRFLEEHNCRGEERIRQRIECIYAARPATEDAATIQANVLRAQALVGLLRELRAHIALYEKRIAELVAQHADAPVFSSLPGAGATLVPRLIVAFGTQRDRFTSARELQCLSGIAPVTERSGQQCWVHMRRACPKFLRQTLHEFAAHSIPYSGWAKAYYDAARAGGKHHHAAVRSLAFKWTRILFRCWKDHKPYDEATYWKALERTGSPLIDYFSLDTAGQWKTEAGFSRFGQASS